MAPLMAGEEGLPAYNKLFSFLSGIIRPKKKTETKKVGLFGKIQHGLTENSVK